MPLEGLRWSRDSGSALYDTPQNGRSRTGWGVEVRSQPAPVAPFVVDGNNASHIFSKIHEYQSGKTKPKDLAMPVRAAMEAGVIRRPTYGEYEAVEELAKIAKTSFSEYVNPDKTPYTDAAFNEMVIDFGHMV